MATASTGIDDNSGGGTNLPPLPVELWQRVVYFIDAWPLRNSGETTRRRALHSLSLVSTWMHEVAQPDLYAYPCLIAADTKAIGQQESKDEERQRRYWEAICARPELWAHTRGIFLGRRRTVVDDTTGRHGGGRAEGSHGTSSRATSSRVRALAHAISSPSSSAWAESFHLLHPYLPTPIGIGPSPLCLREVAWCEVGTGLGGLPASHSYSTRPEGEWCKGAYEMMEQRRRQARAWSVEDVDLGRGPPATMQEMERSARGARDDATGGQRRAAVTETPAAASASSSRYREQPSGLSEDDVWEAAERMTLQQAAVEKVTPVVAPITTLQDSSSPYPASSMASQREDLRDAWLRTTKLQQDRMALEHQKRIQRDGYPSSLSSFTPSLVPWQYHLTLGSLDPHTLPHLICSLPTLTHISLTLYLGTHLDHDLLEHQLRLCLDSVGRLPLLERLEVRAGYDARGGGVGWGGGGSGGTGRLKREAFVRIVKGAVERVGDARCRFVGGGQGDEEGHLVDVRGDAVQAWARSVDESRCASDEVGTVERGDGDGAGKARSRGKPFINGWLARDVRGTNDPIEE